MKIFITGGAGYIGSHACDDLEFIVRTAWEWEKSLTGRSVR